MHKSIITRVRQVTGAFALLTGLCTASASAATLQISPVTVELAQGQNGATLALTNPGSTPIYGQLRVFKWDQENGEDVLLPPEDIVASPPMIQIAAGQSQVVRLVRTGKGGGQKEASYRVLIDEIIDEKTQPRDGVLIRMRYSVPVFADNGLTRGDDPILVWTLLRGPQHWQLRVENKGNRRARLSSVSLQDAKGSKHVVQKGLLGYALSGRYRIWDLDIPVTTNFGEQSVVNAIINAKDSIDKVDVQLSTASAEGKAK